MKEKEKKLFYTWSNVDGEVSVYHSWSELLEKENWEYLSNYDDSLDYFEAGEMIQITSSEMIKGKLYYEDNYGNIHEETDDIKNLYYGKVFLKCVPSQAEEKVLKIQI